MSLAEKVFLISFTTLCIVAIYHAIITGDISGVVFLTGITALISGVLAIVTRSL